MGKLIGMIGDGGNDSVAVGSTGGSGSMTAGASPHNGLTRQRNFGGTSPIDLGNVASNPTFTPNQNPDLPPDMSAPTSGPLPAVGAQPQVSNTPTFLQALNTVPGGMPNALSPALTTKGKVLAVLLAAAKGGLAGEAAGLQGNPRTGYGGAGAGIEAGLQVPFLEKLQQQRVQQGQIQQQVEQAQIQNLPNVRAQQRATLENTQAEAFKNRAQGNKALQPPSSREGTPEQQYLDSLTQQTNPATGKLYTVPEAYVKMKQDTQDTKPDPAATQTQNKLGFQAVVAKVDGAGLSTDPKNFNKSLDSALQKGVITPQEHQLARGYQAANPTPATNLSVTVAGQQNASDLSINKLFEGKDVRVTLPDGSQQVMPYSQAQARGFQPGDMVPLKPQETQKLRDQADTAAVTQNAFQRYQKSFHQYAPTLTSADRSALAVLTSHQDKIAQGMYQSIQTGLLDTMLGQPLTGYSQKLMGGAMTKDQYDNLSTGGKKLVTDYFNAVIQNFGNMKAVMGSVGRNQMQLQAEINSVPLPYLDTQSADAAFADKFEDLKIRNRSLPGFFGQTGGNQPSGRRIVVIK